MRIMNRFATSAVMMALASALWGCSSSNNGAPNLNVDGQHPAGWITGHQAAALTDKSSCFPCHGTDLLGGISKVSCYSAQFNGQFCHAGGPPQSPHPSGWRDPGLHGNTAKAQPGVTSGFAYCQTCHGSNFAGGVTGVSCFVGSRATGSCHLNGSGQPVNAPHAALPWRSYPSPTHTETVDDAAGSNAAVCAQCHTAGNNLSSTSRAGIPTPPPPYATGKPGCFNGTLCHGSVGNPHPDGWVSPNLHCIAARANIDSCQGCHSDNPAGGAGSNPRFNKLVGRLTYTNTTTNITYTGCEVCHAQLAAHPRVMQIPSFFRPMTTFNPIGTPWYLHCKASPSGFDTCNRCHGAKLDGVGAVAGATACTFCHRSGLPSTLLNCTSCHANPPNGTVYPNIARVHAVHTNGTQSVTFTCSDCHFGIGSVTLDHFNRAKNNTTGVQPGAVVFGAFAGTGGLAPAYSDATLTCTNTYCHGATISGGTNKSPIWSSTTYLTAAGCGTCHGFPPPAIPPHTSSMTPTQCIGCHPHVNSSGTGFTDPTKHINGVIDATAGGGGTAHQFPYPGSVHKSAAGASPFAGCLTSGTGCHTNNKSVNYPYPPSSAVPPDCQGCHVKASPGNSCGSCHGTASNGGRPDGLTITTFPNVKGQHSSNHGGFSCSTCHGTAGTGQSTHGNSNFTVHNDANVVVQLPSGITYTRSGLGDGHGTCNGSCNGEGHSNRNW